MLGLEGLTVAHQQLLVLLLLPPQRKVISDAAVVESTPAFRALHSHHAAVSLVSATRTALLHLSPARLQIMPKRMCAKHHIGVGNTGEGWQILYTNTESLFLCVGQIVPSVIPISYLNTIPKILFLRGTSMLAMQSP